MADAITIVFDCPHCKNHIEYDVEQLPSPDWGAETAADSENSDDVDIYCDSCGHEYCLDIFMNIYEGNVVVTDNKNNQEVEPVSVDVHYYEDYEDDEDVDANEEPEYINA
jgi:hypothetical protein